MTLTRSDLRGLIRRAQIDLNSLPGPLSVANGGTGLTSGTSGGILGFTAATTMASSVALTANALVLGGGVGATPTPMGSLGTTTTVLHGNAAGAPTFGAVALGAGGDVTGTLQVGNGGTGLTSGTSGGVLGFTAAGTLASSVALAVNALVIGGGAGATPTTIAAGTNNQFLRGNTALAPAFGTAVLASADFANQGTSTTLLHGNAAGNPSWAAISLTADVTGDLPYSNLAQGSALSVLGVAGNATADVASIAAASDHEVLRRSGITLGFGQVQLGQSAAVAGTLGVGNGGTGITSGTSGGVLAFTAAGTIASSAAFAANQIVLGGGAGVVPATLGSLGTTTTVLHGNAAGAPSFGAVANADLTNASLTYNGVTVALGASGTLTLAAADFANQGTTTTVLHGNAAGNPSWGQVSLTADVTGDLPYANLAQGSALSVLGVTGNATADVASIAAGTDHQVLRRSGLTLAFGALDLSQAAATTNQLPLSAGGSNANLTASNGGIVYSSASAMAILAGTATAGQVLRSGASAAPSWSTATYPATVTANAVLYGTGTNVVGESANLTFNGTTLTANTLTVSTGLLTAAAGLTLSGTASNIALGENYISRTGTDAGMSVDASNNVVTSANLIVNGTLGISLATAGAYFDGGASGDGKNVLILGGTGANFGFVSNFNSTTWMLGYGATKGTLGTAALYWSDSGTITLPSLAGTGTRTVVADTNGVLSAP